MEKNHHSHPGVHDQNWDLASKTLFYQGLLPDKICITDKCGWPWLPEGQLSPATKTLGLHAFLSMEKNCPSSPGSHGQNCNSSSQTPYVQGFLTDESCQYRPAWLALASSGYDSSAFLRVGLCFSIPM